MAAAQYQAATEETSRLHNEIAELKRSSFYCKPAVMHPVFSYIYYN